MHTRRVLPSAVLVLLCGCSLLFEPESSGAGSAGMDVADRDGSGSEEVGEDGGDEGDASGRLDIGDDGSRDVAVEEDGTRDVDGEVEDVEPACLGAADCDDQNPCTADVCAETGCVHTSIDAACDDQNACTQGDRCEGGECKGTPYTCDSTDCMSRRCDGFGGCIEGAVREGEVCGEGSFRVSETGYRCHVTFPCGTCVGGACVPTRDVTADCGLKCSAVGSHCNTRRASLCHRDDCDGIRFSAGDTGGGITCCAGDCM